MLKHTTEIYTDYRGVNWTQRNDMAITAEIMQTYDL